MNTEYYLVIDDSGVVTGAAASNMVPEYAISVDKDTYGSARNLIGSVKWENGEFFPVQQSPKVPARVSRRQFRLQLEAAGLFDKAETWIAGQDRSTQIAYEDSDGFNRSERKLQEAFAAVGCSPSQVDDFFVKASQR